MKTVISFFICLIVCKYSFLQAQQYLYPVDSIYLSGVVFDADSVNTLPHAHILLNEKAIGVTNTEGQFLIHLSRKDTLKISYLGFTDFQYTFPEKTFRDEYFIRVPMSRDSILLQTIDIYPWPKKGAFRQAFLEAKDADKKDQPVTIIGATQYKGPKTEQKPSVANPASLLQKALSKKERNRRKLKKYRKEMQEEHFEFQR